MTKSYTYRVGNWKEYNEALKKRGNIAFWIDENVLENWYNAEKKRTSRAAANLLRCRN